MPVRDIRQRHVVCGTLLSIFARGGRFGRRYSCSAPPLGFLVNLIFAFAAAYLTIIIGRRVSFC